MKNVNVNKIKEKLGLLHIYCGDGKGKTSAAMGLALRALGNGLRVLVVQCLKTGESGEIRALGALPGVRIIALSENYGFTAQMDAQAKARCREEHNHNLARAMDRCRAGEVDMLLLDEMDCAAEMGLIDMALLLDFLDNRPKDIEVVLTGRNPPEALLERADYISEVRKLKHPFDEGVPARKGVEL